MVRHPDEVQQYEREVQILRETQKRTNGMSDGGSLMTAALVPTRVEIIMDNLEPGFWRKNGFKIFHSEFPNLRIKKPK